MKALIATVMRLAGSLRGFVNWLCWTFRIGWKYEGRMPFGHGIWCAVWRNKKTGRMRNNVYLD